MNRNRLLLIPVVAVSIAAGVGIGTAIAGTNDTPHEIEQACRTYIAAYNNAWTAADELNDGALQTSLNHPWARR